MKIAIAQCNFHVGNFEANTTKIINNIQQAKQQQADLIIFSELSVCGYPPRDFLDFTAFIKKSEASVQEIAGLTDDIGVIIGAPTRNASGLGKPLYNSALFLAQCEIATVVNKRLLPSYDIFDETRYFEPGSDMDIIEFLGKRIGITVCEDIWNVKNLYKVDPVADFANQELDFLVNISASPFDYTHHQERLLVLEASQRKVNCPIVYVNQVGGNTDILFDGGSMIMGYEGKLTTQLSFFQEELKTITLQEKEDTLEIKETSKIERIHDALIMGLQDYFGKLGFSKAILGLSGGIDSAVSLALACKALGPKNIKAVLMPSVFSSDHSVTDSEAMVRTVGCEHHIIPIQKLVDNYYKVLEPYFEGSEFGLAEENIQARVRGNLVMAFSNKFGHILLNTSNKSERAVGYGTLYGDLAGGLSVLGDLYKLDVYDLARYINRKEEIIPVNIINKPPSAELRPDQLDSDSLPDYDILDKILYQYIEKQKSPEEIIALGFEKAIVQRVIKMIDISEYKRLQVAPVLRVSPKAFGIGRRMPIVAKYLT